MSLDSHATITYTLMSSCEVIVNGYYGMPMDPLDPYVQLIMEAPPSPDYILGPKYLEYLPPVDDVLPAEEQPLSAGVSPIDESLGYITESEPEMEPEEEDGDDEKSEEDSIEYPTSGGDDDTDDDGDDLSKDDADDEEEEEESSDSEEEEEEHLALTVPAPALQVERLLSIPTPPLSPKRARFTTPTGGYEVGESSVAAAARQIRPALTIADRRRANDRWISRLRIERRYFRTLSTTYAHEVAHSRDYCTQIMDYCQSRERQHIDDEDRLARHIQHEHAQRDVASQRQHIDDEDRLTRHIQHEHAQRDVAPEDGDRVAVAMAEAEASRVRNGYGSNGSGPRLAQAVHECTYPDFLKCQPLNFKGYMSCEDSLGGPFCGDVRGESYGQIGKMGQKQTYCFA
uniref:Reverse transcriptase domain-containing protein n=1 Tax=Tanacetum cinerariifolium TaxID=118510 RepID=A0A699I2H1_TANCI|nr:hypothetical protein [Tanacetum cinerariifolium]